MNFTVTVEGVEELDREWRGTFVPRLAIGATQAVHSAIDAGVAMAKARVPVSQNPRGTHLRDLIAGKILGGAGEEGGWSVVGEIAAPAPYAKFIEDGTRAHDIRPKEGHGFEGPLKSGQSRRAKDDIGTHRIALRWTGNDGKVHFASVVHHPGTAAHPFMGPAYIAAEQRLTARLEVAIATAAAAFGGSGDSNG